ncbi:MAG: dTMP kinase [Anaerovoracaceae bacterium]
MKRGIFITIEGPDGSGKSTQIDNIRRCLEEKGYETIVTREPGGTSISEKIRKVILDKNNNEMNPMTETLLYAASRAQHVAERIGPAVESGRTVICDRFIDSSIAYQGYGRDLGDCVKAINEYAIMGYMPDITFLMKLDPKIGKKRIREEDQDRLEQEKLQFHNKVFKGYLELEKMYPDRIIGIDASKTIEEIRMEITVAMERLLELDHR